MHQGYASLFREEALQAREVRLDGEVLLSRPLRAHAIIGLLTCSVAALAAWVGVGHYARTETARGVLATDAEIAKIMATHPGIVTRVAVTDGQQVRQGAVLATILVDQRDAEGNRATEESLGVLQSQRRLGARQLAALHTSGGSERLGLAATIASAESQYVNVEGQVAVQETALKSLEDAFERYKPIANKGFISQSQMDVRQQQIFSARQQLAQLRQQLITLNSSRSEAMARLHKSKADEDEQASNARSALEGLRAEQARLKAQQAYVLTAPIDGVVTALQTGRGRVVDVSMPLMTIVPDKAAVHADLYAPSRAVGFLKTGDEVRLLYDAFPYQRFGTFKGTVRAVSRVALDPRQIDAPFKMDEPVYRINVTLEHQKVTGYGEQVHLQPGMTLSANIILERRSFVQWLLEPLNAVMKRER